MLYMRTRQVVADLLASEQAPVRELTSLMLAAALEHDDVDVRRVAAALCGYRGVSEGATTGALIAAVQARTDNLVVILAAGALIAYESAPDELRGLCQALLAAMIPADEDAPLVDSDAQAGLGLARIMFQLPALIGIDRSRRSVGEAQ